MNTVKALGLWEDQDINSAAMAMNPKYLAQMLVIGGISAKKNKGGERTSQQPASHPAI